MIRRLGSATMGQNASRGPARHDRLRSSFVRMAETAGLAAAFCCCWITVSAVIPPPVLVEADSRCQRVHQLGREMPSYRGLSGYLVDLRYSPRSRSQKRLPPVPWTVPVFERTGPSRWEPGRARLAAKTPVVVVSQSIVHQGFGEYSGILVVRSIGPRPTEFAVDVGNFSESAYWTCEPHEAARVGPFIARVAQGRMGVSREGRWEPMGKERRVYCDRVGTRRDVPRPVSCLMYKTFQNGFGGVAFDFASSDLTIEY